MKEISFPLLCIMLVMITVTNFALAEYEMERMPEWNGGLFQDDLNGMAVDKDIGHPIPEIV